MANWTQEERDYWFMGPFDGGIPGMIRRIRRILDVSQRGLAALLDVSQSVVARWETGRTSPRMSVLQRLLRMAHVGMTFHDEETGEPVGPMRADGAHHARGEPLPGARGPEGRGVVGAAAVARDDVDRGLQVVGPVPAGGRSSHPVPTIAVLEAAGAASSTARLTTTPRCTSSSPR